MLITRRFVECNGSIHQSLMDHINPQKPNTQEIANKHAICSEFTCATHWRCSCDAQTSRRQVASNTRRRGASVPSCRLLQHACCLRLRRSATSICGIINTCTIASDCTTVYVALVSASLPVANSRQANIHIFRN